ncbi:MAG: hypothetical protein WCX83_03065 [Candidatus Cloacimonas sp.]|jgi:hypothetical protein|nr:hypothetical protein [Candidatus Cloacimonadota bacterium]
MSKSKILSLKLFYKGKNLDIARENRDIKNKFVIGSDKHMYWQILDKNFPKKHLLVKKVKDDFKMFINKNMQLTVNKDGQALNADALKAQNLLSGNTLMLDRNTTGSISFSNDWRIEYEFIQPFVTVMTDEDRRLIALYHRRPPLGRQEKLARNLLIIAFLVVLIGGLLFDRLYTPPVYERSIASRVSVDVAPITSVDTDYVMEEVVIEDIEPEPVGDETSASDATATGGRHGGASSILGFDIGSGTGGGGPAIAVDRGPSVITYSEQIVARGAGGGGSGAGPGRGPASTPGRASSNFDVGAAPSSSVKPGTLFGGDVSAAKKLGMKEVDASVLGGVTGEIQAAEIITTDQLEALARAKQRAFEYNLETVDEAKIESAPQEYKDDLTNVRQYIQPNMRQIDDLFKQETQIRRIYGSIEVTLYFSPSGQVEAVDIKERAGSFFTPSFKAKATEIMMQWRVPTKKQLPPYRFPYRFH